MLFYTLIIFDLLISHFYSFRIICFNGRDGYYLSDILYLTPNKKSVCHHLLKYYKTLFWNKGYSSVFQTFVPCKDIK